MTFRVAAAMAVLCVLSGCSTYDPYAGFDDGWPAPGYVWTAEEGYVPSFGAPVHRTGNPFYGRAAYFDPGYCPPVITYGRYSNARYYYGRGGRYYGRTGYTYGGSGRYVGRVDPDKIAKRERKQERKALKRERKLERKAFKQERKLQKKAFKQERKIQKRQAKFERKQAKRHAKQQRKQAKRERKRQ